MKDYERAAEGSLMRKTPVILRVDGKAFHTFTRGMAKPFDLGMEYCMMQTALSLCENIDGARLAYTQSDEISVLIADWSSLQAQPWLGYRIQKLASVAASIATAAFNRAKEGTCFTVRGEVVPGDVLSPLALFDARVFNVPHHEVVNYFIWRQQDAVRNSISGLAQSHFSHKSLHGVSQSGMQDKLRVEKGVNWNDLPTHRKRGYCVVRKEDPTTGHFRWTPDLDIPVFAQDRDYIKTLAEEGIL